ncbi:hypothetical protein [Streptomyces goshikiensis]|uniref:hypothetical protein n=1 Tax=Streptomyces goshikiensis TaxID=1942 RepID=UPI0036C4E06B
MKQAIFRSQQRGIATMVAAAGAAVALTATVGSGVSYADGGSPLGVPTSSISADGKFFTPGPNTVVKRNASEPGVLLADNASPIAPAPAGTTDYYVIKNAQQISQSCGTNLLQATSGRGKTTLVLSVEKKRAGLPALRRIPG